MDHHSFAARVVFGISVLVVTPAICAGAEPRIICEVRIPPYDDCLAVPVEVLGRKVEFLFDTGATVTLFDPDFIKDGLRLSVLPDDVIGGTDAFGKEVQLRRCESPELKLGALVDRGSGCAVHDLTRLRAILDRPIYGILGMDFVGQRAIRIDWDARKLYLMSRGYWKGETTDNFAELLPLGALAETFIGFPDAQSAVCALGSVCAIDTGFCGDVSLDSATFKELTSRGHCTPRVFASAAIAAGGERADVRTGDLQSAVFVLGAQCPWVPGVVADEGQRNLLGIGYLSRFGITLDVRQGKLWYAKSKSFDEPRPRNESGLRLIRKGTEIVVDSIAKQSPAMIAGFDAGDVLTAVNGIAASELKLYDVSKVLKESGGRPEFTFRRGPEFVRARVELPKCPQPVRVAANFEYELNLKSQIVAVPQANRVPTAAPAVEMSAEEMAIRELEKLGAIVRRARRSGESWISIDLENMKVPVSDARLATLAWMRKLPALRLSLRGTEVTDAGMKELAAFTSLERLDVGHTRITDDGLNELGGLTSLREFGASKIRITDAGLGALARMDRLAYVDLKETDISNEGVRHLRHLPALKTLCLGKTRVTGEAFGELTALRSLAVLHLVDSPVTDAGVGTLVAYESLHTLSLGGSNVTDAGCIVLGKLQSLRTLDLSRTAVTGEGFKECSGLRKLASLYCQGAPVTDSALKHIGRIASLRFLDLARTNVTDAGLVELEGLVSLKTLDLRETMVTRNGAGRLREKLVACKILQ